MICLLPRVMSRISSGRLLLGEQIRFWVPLCHSMVVALQGLVMGLDLAPFLVSFLYPHTVLKLPNARCIALGTPASDHEDSLCMLANAEEDAGNPLSAYAALRQLSGRSLAPPNRSCRASHGSLPCCLPTSSIEFISIAVWPSQEITPNRSTSC
jgi:hypothetical protein